MVNPKFFTQRKNQVSKLPKKYKKFEKNIKNYLEENVKMGVLEEIKNSNITNTIFFQEKDSIKKENILFLNPTYTNKISENKNVYLPEPKKILKKFKNSFTVSLDMSQAFYSIPLHQEYKKYTAFKFGKSYYQFRVLPFGLLNSPYYLQRFLSRTLNKIKEEISMKFKINKNKIFYSNYMDDSLFIFEGGKYNLNRIKKLEISKFIDERIKFYGFISNEEKYTNSMNNKIKWLGYEIDIKNNKITYKPKKFHENIKYIYRELKNTKNIKIYKFMKIFGILNIYNKFYPMTFLKKYYGKIISKIMEKYRYVFEYKKLYKNLYQEYREKIGIKIYGNLLNKKIKNIPKEKYAKFWYNEYVNKKKLKLNINVRKKIHIETMKILLKKYKLNGSPHMKIKDVYKKLKHETIELGYKVKLIIYKNLKRLQYWKPKIPNKFNLSRKAMDKKFNLILRKCYNPEEDYFQLTEKEHIYYPTHSLKTLFNTDQKPYRVYELKNITYNNWKYLTHYESLHNYIKNVNKRPKYDYKNSESNFVAVMDAIHIIYTIRYKGCYADNFRNFKNSWFSKGAHNNITKNYMFTKKLKLNNNQKLKKYYINLKRNLYYTMSIKRMLELFKLEKLNLQSIIKKPLKDTVSPVWKVNFTNIP